MGVLPLIRKRDKKKEREQATAATRMAVTLITLATLILVTMKPAVAPKAALPILPALIRIVLLTDRVIRLAIVFPLNTIKK